MRRMTDAGFVEVAGTVARSCQARTRRNYQNEVNTD